MFLPPKNDTDTGARVTLQCAELMAPKAGWIYACCTRGDLHAVKVGYTTNLVPEDYCHREYSRTFVPLEIEYAFSTANARLAESITHYIIRDLSRDPKHEVFDLRDNMHLLDEAKEMVHQLDHKAGLEVPSDRLVSYAWWKTAREAYQAGARRLKVKEKERQLQIEREEKGVQEKGKQKLTQEDKERARANAREAAKADRANAKVAAREAQKAEEEAQAAEDNEVIKDFVARNTQTSQDDDFVRVRDLFADYEKLYQSRQRDEKSHMTFKAFLAHVLHNLPTTKFVKEHRYRDEDARNRTICSVLMGCSRR